MKTFLVYKNEKAIVEIPNILVQSYSLKQDSIFEVTTRETRHGYLIINLVTKLSEF